MDLDIKGNNYIVSGAGAGFGKAIANQLVVEGANVLAVSRTMSKLTSLKAELGNAFNIMEGNITSEKIQSAALGFFKNKPIHGVVINASGPPAGSVSDLNIQMWDDAWENIVRWKISFVYKILPVMKKQGFGKLLFIESVSVKEPVENLVLSNSLRMSVVGYAKTLAREVASSGINVNILAPGYHATDAMKRLFVKRSEVKGISVEDAKHEYENEIPVGTMGKPEEMATIACWLLSPLSRYVTGQTITHDGGLVRSVFG